MFRRGMADGMSVSLETTLTGNTILRRMSDAKANGYEVHLWYVALDSAALHIDRVRQRVRKGGHDIPADTIVRRYQSSLNNLSKAVAIADYVTVIDNSGRDDRMLLRSEFRTVIELNPTPPKWLQDKLPEILDALAQTPAK